MYKKDLSKFYVISVQFFAGSKHNGVMVCVSGWMSGECDLEGWDKSAKYMEIYIISYFYNIISFIKNNIK